MENKFTEAMAKCSDSELLEIVTLLRDDYQPEAVEAAKLELEKRDLSSEQLENVKEKVNRKEILSEEKKNTPLDAGEKFLFFIFFWGIFPWLKAGRYKDNGYDRKHKEAWKFMNYGLFSFIGFVILIILLVRITS